jgi:hypothetical protein
MAHALLVFENDENREICSPVPLSPLLTNEDGDKALHRLVSPVLTPKPIWQWTILLLQQSCLEIYLSLL